MERVIQDEMSFANFSGWRQTVIWICKRCGGVEAILQPSEAALVSLGTPVSCVARSLALAPRVPFNLCSTIGTSGLTAKPLHRWLFTCQPRPCESTSTLHTLLRPDLVAHLVLRGISLRCGWKSAIRARVPGWICGGHAHYLQLCP